MTLVLQTENQLSSKGESQKFLMTKPRREGDSARKTKELRLHFTVAEKEGADAFDDEGKANQSLEDLDMPSTIRRPIQF